VKLSEKTSLLVILLLLISFAAGWFAHQALLPFLDQAPATQMHKTAGPGELVNQSRVIFKAEKTGNFVDQKIRVEQVTVLQELPDSVLMEIRYHYSDTTPANEVKMFIGLGSKYLYLGSNTIQSGDGVLRLAVGLNESDMKQDKISQFKSDRMQVSFEHYPPGQYKGVLASTYIPFMKEWKSPQN